MLLDFDNNWDDYNYVAGCLMHIKNMLFDTPINLKVEDTQYPKFIEALKIIISRHIDLDNEFGIDINSSFTTIRKSTLPERFIKERKEIKRKKLIENNFIHSYNNSDNSSVKQDITQNEYHMAKKNDTTTDPTVLIIKRETIELAFKERKAEMEALIEKCEEITIISSAEMALSTSELLKSVHSCIKQIDIKRASIKEPYLNAGKLIDGKAKEISGDGDKIIARFKILLADWDKKVAAEKALADLEAQRLREEENKKAEAAQNKITEIRNYIINTENSIATKIISTMDLKSLGAIYKEYIAPFQATEENFGSLKDEAAAMKDRIISFGIEKDTFLRNGSTEQAWNNAKAKYAHLVIAATAHIESAAEAATQKVILQAEVNKSDITASQFANTAVKTVGTRKFLKWKITDQSKVPLDFYTIDPAKIDLAKDQYKDQIVAGQYQTFIPGVEFYWDEQIVVPR